MNVGPIGPSQGPERIEPKRKVDKPSPKAPDTIKDDTTLSLRGRLISEARNMPAVRIEKVNRLKEEVEQGKYESPAKLLEALSQFTQENRDIVA